MDLQRIIDICDAATYGPWEWEGGGMRSIPTGYTIACAHGTMVAIIKADRDFIIHARANMRDMAERLIELEINPKHEADIDQMSLEEVEAELKYPCYFNDNCGTKYYAAKGLKNAALETFYCKIPFARNAPLRVDLQEGVGSKIWAARQALKVQRHIEAIEDIL